MQTIPQGVEVAVKNSNSTSTLDNNKLTEPITQPPVLAIKIWAKSIKP